MPRFRFLLAFAFCILTTFPAFAARDQNWKVAHVNFLPVACSRNDCWAHNQNATKHEKPKPEGIQLGNIQLIYADNRKIQATHGATIVGDRSTEDGATANAQVSPDKKTVGWTHGKHQKCTDWSVGGPMFVNSQLVLFSGGRVLRVLEVRGTFIEN